MEKNGGGWTVSDAMVFTEIIRIFKKITLIICTLFISFREKRRNNQE
jgi:hypothetical protein